MTAIFGQADAPQENVSAVKEGTNEKGKAK